MNATKLLAVSFLCAGALSLGGCDKTMTDGGAIGRNVDQWKLEDQQNSQTLKPTLQSYWQKEKAKWPIFEKNCEDAESCYEKSMADKDAAK